MTTMLSGPDYQRLYTIAHATELDMTQSEVRVAWDAHLRRLDHPYPDADPAEVEKWRQLDTYSDEQVWAVLQSWKDEQT